MRFQLNHIGNLLKKSLSIKIYDCTVLSKSWKSRHYQAGNIGFIPVQVLEEVIKEVLKKMTAVQNLL